ncbi:MAG: NADH-quinone oxidoreductase subunit NuoE [Candidatus Zixiibacteriota bacterium]|nr:MAG: NADH-quinone oxidoreductase subunit NuoE [candidate division Zixibacteria bacterium]
MIDKSSKGLLSESSKEKIEGLICIFPDKQSIILPVLHVIYDQLGYLDSKAIKEAASITEIPDVYFEEAASFYTMFPLEPVGKYLIQVCHNISCTLMGAESLIDYIKEKLGIKPGGTTADGLFTLVTVECLGSCGTAPVMRINDTYYENLTKAKVDKILETLRNQA